MAVIHNRGWTQGEFQDGQGGPVCLLGACGAAWFDDANTFGTTYPAHLADDAQEVAEAIRTHRGFQSPGEGADYVVAWNDDPDTDEEDVLNLLATLAKEADK